MRELSYIVLGIVFLSSLVQPFTEMAEACRQKIVINSAINNSFRAARDRSLKEESMQNLDAEIDIEAFYDYFSDAFCNSLDLSEASRNQGEYGSMTFDSYNDDFNEIHVEFQISDGDDYDDKEKKQVEIYAKTNYKFKVGILKALEDKSKYDDYALEFKKEYLLFVKN
ncbi:hypothetical protein [Cellulosilyticum lentocellum]|uniref:Uncharacterized protein n=1 Tax=Cellulosilyticum lentocellum (strain ATCC 49066 / DSM 5427 / NCIMB 11756 / RHM5) TaxID=642492 RepID=F2JHU9_CELLD|nr:hypothetical protein [Cellulosilyticum lentocellum]ADZ85441.1 hypothetical protein Clole_3761 [Cellulosilyticum lentocellum DSM 5427]